MTNPDPAPFRFRHLAALVVVTAGALSAGPARSDIVITAQPDRLTVFADGEHFTDLHLRGQRKPVLYPVLGPNGIPMTRNFPIRKGVPGEAEDHPHHRSLWFTHGDVNGISFWHEDEGSGRIVHDRILAVAYGVDGGWITTANHWEAPDGSTVCTDETTYYFDATDSRRIIDVDIRIIASHGDLVFGDTKEGSMGIRTHPNLRLKNDPGRGVTTANGHAVNSEGLEGPGIWGKRASWVDYWGEIHGRTVGVAIFDSPDNPRHPTWWHARDYGLVAANPFGIHDFERKPDGTGDLSIPAGETLRLRYRFVFHTGDTETANIGHLYKVWTGEAGQP